MARGDRHTPSARSQRSSLDGAAAPALPPCEADTWAASSPAVVQEELYALVGVPIPDEMRPQDAPELTEAERKMIADAKQSGDFFAKTFRGEFGEPTPETAATMRSVLRRHIMQTMLNHIAAGPWDDARLAQIVEDAAGAMQVTETDGPNDRWAKVLKNLHGRRVIQSESFRAYARAARVLPDLLTPETVEELVAKLSRRPRCRALLEPLLLETTTNPAHLLDARRATLDKEVDPREYWWDVEPDAESASQALKRARRAVEDAVSIDKDAESLYIRVPVTASALNELADRFPGLAQHTSLHGDAQGQARWGLTSASFTRGNLIINVQFVTTASGHDTQQMREYIEKHIGARFAESSAERPQKLTLHGADSDDGVLQMPTLTGVQSAAAYDNSHKPGVRLALEKLMDETCSHRQAQWRPRRSPLNTGAFLELHCPDCLSQTLDCVPLALLADSEPRRQHLHDESPRNVVSPMQLTQAAWAMDPSLMAVPSEGAIVLSERRIKALGGSGAGPSRRRLRA